ncbi:helix-turn-helix transcriptional regulator [Citrobacter amalonaticus]|uniref:Helix-turn-helix transcriptional regulator n=1 Tax=Citrobacter amalonaticus TaxID=35703 RepID=A0A9C7V3Y7_CITAM|nr:MULTISPECIES: helix-turn-helix transcriptional regulator [Enterobacter]ELJ9615304.1 helix-turn-helix transcriptional regulator [Enterobacter hormaechei]MDU1755529.1 helix-turn-helix transcriptional regulator [Citrobacter sp.]HCC6168746.1 helix-turn-helix transcriptional regulator [Citrobacter amalonaticus]MDN2617835.1 helix-turn-helix domain-containing protein [Enterobacter kobei]MDY0423955.1 helix-turn-helix transcriptional regulator [Enterobacter sp. 170250]
MNNLRKLRKSLHLTQRGLAEEIGQTISSIGHYESGRRSPDIKTCHQLVEALSKNGKKLTIEDIFPPASGAGDITD